MADHDLIFLTNRRTPKVVPKGEKYEPTEAEGKIESRRAATEEEEKTIANGDWLRVNSNGDTPGDSNYMNKKSKVRPQLNAAMEINIPAIPPDEWFAPLHDVEPYDVVVTADGHIHGFPAASWNDCHLSYPDQCVTPPRSMTDYTLFKVGQVVTASGAVVRTGPITLRGGHAPHGVTRQAAQAYYDDTDSAIADVAIGDGQHGIWINGAIRPDVKPEEVRRAMSSGFSGDWREWQGNLELIAFSAVNTPGFRRKAALYEVPVPMAASGEPVDTGFGTGGMTMDIPAGGIEQQTEDHDAVLLSAVDRVARSIGRHPSQRLDEVVARRIEAIHDRVHRS